MMCGQIDKEICNYLIGTKYNSANVKVLRTFTIVSITTCNAHGYNHSFDHLSYCLEK